MIKVGIDTLAFYTPHYALSLGDLASARAIDADKYYVGLGQQTMAVPPPGEDIVTMGANAAIEALRGLPVDNIEMLLFATESGIDQSKAAGIYIHDLIGLPPHCRVVEFKQACYSATSAIQLAMPFLREQPHKKILVVASDVARYGLNTAGESSQGAGAIAMVLSAQPRLLVIEPEYAVLTENVMDFWRPNYLHEALVDGKYSSKLYLTMLEKCWQQYRECTGRTYADHNYFCYHVPVPRLVEKAHQHLLKINGLSHFTSAQTDNEIQAALTYGRKLGNSYTASLYIALASLLDHATEDLSEKRIGFYSYGSGCVAEYFSGVVQPGYQTTLHTIYHQQLLSRRIRLSYEEYVSFYQFRYVEDGSDQSVPVYHTGDFRMTALRNHKRIYEKVLPHRMETDVSSTLTSEPAKVKELP